MKDIIKKYKNHKIISNIKIVLASLTLAVLVNFFLLDWTIIQNNIKTSILDTKTVTSHEEKADIYLEKINNDIYLKLSKNINFVKTISLSFAYNPENLNIEDITSQYWDIDLISNTPWITQVILNIEKDINLRWGGDIIKINANKKLNTSENLNIINANFSDKNEKFYLLTTSSITF